MSDLALLREKRVTIPQLQLALGPALEHSGRRQAIMSVDRRPSPYSTSFSLEEIDVQLANGTRLELMFKDLNWYSMLKSAQLVKPFFLYDPVREIETYRRMLRGEELGTAKCFGSVIDADAGHYWLFMERVAGLQLRHVGEWEVWLEAARWLARLHSGFRSDTRLLKMAHRCNLLSYDRTFYRQWIIRAEVLLHRKEVTHSASARRDIRWLASRYHKVIESLVALPTTFIHGEFYASNIVIPPLNGQIRLCPVDWEMAAIGPGAIDLAALCAGNWTDEQKLELAEAYRGAYAGRAPRTWRSFLADLDRCYLHQAIQWLGWSLEWDPPEDQTRNWLEIALRLAQKLKL